MSHLCRLQTQHEDWQSRRWTYAGNVLQTYSSTRQEPKPSGPLKIFVTLGTIKPYRFDAAVNAVLSTGLTSETTVWQLGETNIEDLPGSSYKYIGTEQFKTFAQAADVVVTHAGVGTILQLLDWGVYPVVLVRRAERGEHVDDHQEQISELLARLRVSSCRECTNLRSVDLIDAALRAIVVPSGELDDERQNSREN